MLLSETKLNENKHREENATRRKGIQSVSSDRCFLLSSIHCAYACINMTPRICITANVVYVNFNRMHCILIVQLMLLGLSRQPLERLFEIAGSHYWLTLINYAKTTITNQLAGEWMLWKVAML